MYTIEQKYIVEEEYLRVYYSEVYLEYGRKLIFLDFPKNTIKNKYILYKIRNIITITYTKKKFTILVKNIKKIFTPKTDPTLKRFARI